jgi:hypothetical protein
VAEPGRVSRSLGRLPHPVERGGGRRPQPEDRGPPRVLQGLKPDPEAVFGRRCDKSGRDQDPEGAARIVGKTPQRNRTKIRSQSRPAQVFGAQGKSIQKFEIIIKLFCSNLSERKKVKTIGRGSERRRSERRQAKNFRTSKWSF